MPSRPLDAAVQGPLDAALAEALHGLTYDAAFSGQPEHPFGAGALASEVESLGSNRYRIRATGIYRDQRRTVEARALRAPGGARVTEWRRLRESLPPTKK